MKTTLVLFVFRPTLKTILRKNFLRLSFDYHDTIPFRKNKMFYDVFLIFLPIDLQTTIQSQPFMLMAGNQKISQTAATNSPSGPFLTPPLTSPVTTVPPLQQIDYNINKTLNNTPSKSFFCFIFILYIIYVYI